MSNINIYKRITTYSFHVHKKLKLQSTIKEETPTLEPEGESTTLHVLVLKALAIPAANGSPRRFSGSNFLTSDTSHEPKYIYRLVPKTFIHESTWHTVNKHSDKHLMEITSKHFVKLSGGTGEQEMLRNLQLLLVGNLSIKQ